ncbi:MAG: methyltransferase domain-containing protein [Caldilineales bacterium]
MTDHSPTIEDRARAIFGQRADFYTTSAVHADPQALHHLVDLVRPQPDWRVLDVATGTGHAALAFAPHVREVIGIDLTPAMLAEATRLAATRGQDNVQFVVADIHELPFDDETFDDEQFDLVICRRAAHHFSHIRDALGEMARMLKPGGLLLIDDRSVPENDFVDSVMNRLDWLHDESHVREYRPSQWQAMVEAAGCQVVLMEPFTLHRPLSSFTGGVSAANVAQIHTMLAGFSAQQRAQLKFEAQDGEFYITHWYVIVAARKQASAIS